MPASVAQSLPVPVSFFHLYSSSYILRNFLLCVSKFIIPRAKTEANGFVILILVLIFFPTHRKKGIISFERTNLQLLRSSIK